MDPHVGYCTNVHAGGSFDEMQANLRRYATAVKSQCFPDSLMGVGLWLSNETAAQLRQPGSLQPFKAWLDENGLTPYTLNGFPYGDFHQPVVKHLVYQPTWMEAARRTYTEDLIAIQHALLPEGAEGSISTLPIAWGQPQLTASQRTAAAENLRAIAETCRQLEQETGRLIYLCIEPEPGCFIERTDDLIRFYEDDLLAGDADEATVRRYLRVCHDVCHAVVMFEPQREVWAKFQAAGIAVGKVQVSSAVCADLDAMEPEHRVAAIEQLAGFREERYLHQTSVRTADGETRFFEDLPLALDWARAEPQLHGTWRVHFHVPIYLEQFDHLRASRREILDCLQAAKDLSDVKHFEVETYAWGVLPKSLQVDDLANGIAAELKWFAEQQEGSGSPTVEG